MKLGKIVSRISILLILGVILVSVVYAQEPVGEQSGEAIDTQTELGPSGLVDPPPLGGLKALYLFTGVYNETTDPEFATVVHCSNYGSADVDVLVQFFNSNPTDPDDFIYAYGTISSNDTMTFSSQQITSFANEEFALLTEDIQHGSGRVLVTDSPDTKVICTVQVLALNSSDVPTDITQLHLFDSDGNLINNNPGSNNEGIFLPIILKNS